MKQGLTEIVCIIDKSGSMHPIKADAIGAFNNFLEGQKALPGEARVTITLFDTDYCIACNGMDIRAVPWLTDKTYCPGGSTALLDAIGRTIDEVGVRLDKTPENEKPEKVIVVILTDGEENASKKYSKDDIFRKIALQRNTYSWEFVYLGANQDAIKEASAMGIYLAQGFVATGCGVREAFNTFETAVSSCRTKGKVDL